MTTKEEIELNTVSEYHAFYGIIGEEIFPILIEEGIDVGEVIYSIIQPYSSGHCLQQRIRLDEHNDRILTTNVCENLEEVDLTDCEYIIELETKPGKLDVFNLDLQDERMTELTDIVSKVNSQV